MMPGESQIMRIMLSRIMSRSCSFGVSGRRIEMATSSATCF